MSSTIVFQQQKIRFVFIHLETKKPNIGLLIFDNNQQSNDDKIFNILEKKLINEKRAQLWKKGAWKGELVFNGGTQSIRLIKISHARALMCTRL